MKITLTTDHSASSYGLPVLVIDGHGYGPADILPDGRKAAYTVAEWQANECATLADALDARAFLAQWPNGPQGAEVPASTAARLMGITRQALQALILRGRLQATKRAGAVMVPLIEIEGFRREKPGPKSNTPV